LYKNKTTEKNDMKTMHLLLAVTFASATCIAADLVENPGFEVLTDKNAVNDALKIGVPIVAFCDTNNQSNNVDLVVPCNNKGKKSVGLLFYLLTRELLRKRGVLPAGEEMKEKIEDFTEE